MSLFAEHGNVTGQLILWAKYMDGKGVLRDYMIVKKWLLIAAEQRNADAQFLLGSKYVNGDGVNQDLQNCPYIIFGLSIQ